MNKISDLITRFKDLSTIGFANLTSNAISGVFWFYLASLLGTAHYGEVSYFISIASIASHNLFCRCRKYSYNLHCKG